MTLQGIIIIDIICICLILMIVNSIRKHRLYVGFGVMWLVILIGVIPIVSFRPFLNALTRMAGAIFPVSALVMCALVIVIIILIYFSIQLSMLSDKLTKLIQFIALSNAQKKSELEDIEK